MKKTVLAALATVILFGTACDKNENPEIHDFSKTIGLLFFEPVNDWRQEAVNYGVAKATVLGYDYDLKLSANADQQQSAMNSMISKGISTLVICDQGLSAATINSAVAKGVNVVLFDGDVDCNYTCYVSSSQEDMGRMAGNYLKNKPIKKIIAFDILSAQSTSKIRVDTFKETVGSDKQVQVIGIDAYTPEAGKKVLNQVIAANPDAIWVQDDQVLMGILESLMNEVPNLKYISSGGAYQPLLKVIKENTSDIDISTVSFSPQTIEEAIAIAGNLTKGIDPAQKRIIIPGSLITKDNVDKFIKQGVKF